MDNLCDAVNSKLDDVLGKLEQIHTRLLSVENKVEQLNHPHNEVCILVDKPSTKKEEVNVSSSRLSKYKSTLKTNFFDNKNETKWVIQNKIMKKALKIQTMKISRLELKEKLLVYMNHNLCLDESMLKQLDILSDCMDANILMNETMKYHDFESFVNLLMNKHCIKK